MAIEFIWGINVNWDSVGAISETVGAIAVVVSLVYLALQIKKNTNLAKSEYHTASVAGAARFYHWKSANLENATIFTVGMKDFLALSIQERVILDGILMDLVLTFRDIQEAHERGLMELDTYNAWESFLGTTLGMPGGKMWWEQARAHFLVRVQAAIDSGIEKTLPFNELMSIIYEEGIGKLTHPDSRNLSPHLKQPPSPNL